MSISDSHIDFAMEQIVTLCRIPSPSGFTRQAETYLLDTLRVLGLEPVRTRKGSILADLGGEGEPLVLAAHVDTLGAMVRALKDGGRLRISNIGGFPMNFVETENCLVHSRRDEGRTFTGTIQITHPAVHVYADAGTQKRNDENVEVVLDVLARTKDDLKALGISAGDFVSFDPRAVITECGFLKSRHLDDKASAGILIALAKALREEGAKLSRKVYILFTTYEEVGHGGAAGVPDDVVEMISVDMGAVGDDLETDETKVSICAKDSGGPYDYEVTNRLARLAREEGLDFAVDIYPRYGSDVEAALHAGYDLRHGLIGPGVFASHGYERTHRKGVENTLKLLYAYLLRD
jgi:putative aminopeptidase FrvX